jgi:hypothetical protein
MVRIVAEAVRLANCFRRREGHYWYQRNRTVLWVAASLALTSLSFLTGNPYKSSPDFWNSWCLYEHAENAACNAISIWCDPNATQTPLSCAFERRHCATLFPVYYETNRMFLEGQLVRRSWPNFLKLMRQALMIKSKHFVSSCVEDSQLIQRNLDQIHSRWNRMTLLFSKGFALF